MIVQSSDRVFAQHLVEQGALPQIAFTDAVHIAVSAIRAIPYLATWNFAHLANPHTRPKIEQVCRNAGLAMPCIDTPETYWRNSLMYDEILKECLEAKKRLVALFGDLETYMEFMTKQQEKQMKQGIKYIDLPVVRIKKQEKPNA